MSTKSLKQLMSIRDYLDGELASEIKHEYIGGVIHKRADNNNCHNLIASNCTGHLHFALRGKLCRPYNSDTKVRIQLPTQTRFYYPDAMVVCKSNPGADSYQDSPNVIVEVLSRRTRRIDLGEKKDAYLTIPSLKVYLLVEQETAAVTIHRRGEQGFQQEYVEGIDAVIPLPEIETELPLAELYDGVVFTPEPEEDPLHP